jgi:DNA-binding beta-propeller fold protein YncE
VFGSSRAVRWRTTPEIGIDYRQFIAGCGLVALERVQYSKSVCCGAGRSHVCVTSNVLQGRGSMFARIVRITRLVVAGFIVGGLPFACSIEQDKKAPRGCLYVVDSNNGRAKAQILFVDPEKEAVVRSFDTGMSPDIAVAPDGKRLYVGFTTTDGEINRDRLVVVDTSSGEVLFTTDNPNRSSYNVYPPSSTMALSADGRWLYVMTLSPSTRDREVQVVCAKSKEVHLLRISETGAAIDSVVSLKSHAAGVFSFRDQNLFVMRDGRILKVDASTKAATEVAAIGLPSGAWVHSLVLDRNRSTVFLGLRNPIPAAGPSGTSRY